MATSIVSPSRIRVAGLKRPTSARRLARRELLDRAIVSDVLGQLADLLGDRWARRDREVHETSEPSASRSSAWPRSLAGGHR